MNADYQQVLYLSRHDVESLAISMTDIIDCTELALKEKGKGKAVMPAKHWLAMEHLRFFSAMSGALPTLGVVTCKWQSGSPENRKRGLSYITGLLLLNDLDTGLPVAIMDSTWLTTQRTAAATAVTARYLAGERHKTLGLIGCGVQGRSNLEALRVEFPDLEMVHAFDNDAAALHAYADEISARFGVTVRKCATPHEAVSEADIVVTGGSIVPEGDHAIERRWLSPGALLVTLDYDCYLAPSALGEFDRLFVDDLEQMEHLKAYGFFESMPSSAMDLGRVVCGGTQGRLSPQETILSINMGIAVEDTSLAREIHERARKRNVGKWLPL